MENYNGKLQWLLHSIKATHQCQQLEEGMHGTITKITPGANSVTTQLAAQQPNLVTLLGVTTLI